METTRQDLRYAWRTLCAQPGFTAIAVLTLALGVAANTVMFSVVNGVLLIELPYPEPDRLVLVRVSVEGIESLPSVAPPEVIDFRERTSIFEDVAAIRDASATLTGVHEPLQLQIGQASWNFLSLLGIEPLLGRGFSAQDAGPGAPPRVIISHGLWQRQYGGDPGLVGRSLRLNGTATTVVGILPPHAELLLPREAGLPTELDAWWPFRFDFGSAPRFRWIRAVGRLRPHVTLAQAQSGMDVLAEQLIEEHADYRRQHFRYELVPLHADLVRKVRTPLLVLFGAVGFVLLIACANVANLLLARAAEREHEMCTRAALGASRGRIIRQLLTEGVLLAALGGAAALVLAGLGLYALLRLAPPGLPRLNMVSLDWRVLGFTLAACLLTVLVFGLVPALQASRPGLGPLKSGWQGVGRAESARLRRLLVTAEIALSLVLLVGAGLMIRSFVALSQVRPGFEPDQLLTFEIAVPNQRYRTQEQLSRFLERLAQKVEALPGVEAFGGSFPLPLSGRFWTNTYAPEGEAERSWGALESDNHTVLPGFFRAIGARVLRGRTFSWADNSENRKVIVVDDKLARKSWPDADPIGQRVKVLLPNDARDTLEVIGVVEHLRQDHPGLEGREQTYMLPVHWPQWILSLTLRTDLPPDSALSAVTHEVQELDPDLAIYKPRSMRAYFGEVVGGNRFAMLLMAVFASLAALLAAVGLYGTIAYTVTQRRHEIGIRLALGADPSQLLRDVVAQGMRLAGLGIALGVAASLGLTRVLVSLLYEVRPFDLPTYAAITLLLALLVWLACYVPARRAARVEPMIVLRYE